MTQGSPSSNEEAGSQQGAKAGGEDEVYKCHFSGQAGKVDEMGECGTTQVGSMEESRISLLFRSTYDVLPSLQNLNLWVGEDPSCPLCSSPATLRYI